jgi:protein SCO1/2
MSASASAAAARLGRRTHARWRTLLACAVVAAAGCYATYAATDGLKAFSLESARRLSALRSPAPVPSPTLEYADARRAPLIEHPGQILLVDFIYTRCTSYCQALGSVYAQLQGRLAPELAAGKVRLVSITFDPAHDRAQELDLYRGRYGADAPGWTLARPLAHADLQQLLRAFGVVVIDDGLGGYTHNAAVHVVDAQGRLAAILDASDMEGVVRFTRELLERS